MSEKEILTKIKIRGAIESFLDDLSEEQFIEECVNLLKNFEPAIINVEDAFLGFVIGNIYRAFVIIYNNQYKRHPTNKENEEFMEILNRRMPNLLSKMREIMMK